MATQKIVIELICFIRVDFEKAFPRWERPFFYGFRPALRRGADE